MAENNYKQELQEIEAEIKKLTGSLSILDTELISISANARKALTNVKAVSPTEITTQIKQLETVVGQLNKKIADQEAVINRLTEAKSKKNKLTSEEIVNQRALAKAADNEAKANSKLVGAYQNLISKRDQAKKKLQDLIAAEKSNTSEIKKAQKEYDKLNNKINQANKATSNFSKTGLGGAVKGFKNLLGAFGVVGGVQLIASLTKNVFELAKQFDSFRFAMSSTIKSSVELAETQQFLDRITQDYGADLITTTERYIKFDAAARQSNVSLQETQRIFDTVTKAAGTLGLKTDELSGVYLALEQMLSKGKVSTEELRRQLGERLPGAFGIMAKAIGVSTAKLDDMLKKGEVLSKDALPKFATELEKAYGLDSVKKIDTLQAAQTRLSNAWAMFVRDISGSDSILQSVFKGSLNFMSNLLEGIKDVSAEIKEAFKSEATKAFEKEQNAFTKAQKDQVESLNSYKDANERANEAIRQRFALEDNLAKNILENQEKIIGKENTSLENAKEQARLLVDSFKNYKDYKSLINDLTLREDIYERNRIATIFARIKGIDEVLAKAEEEIEAEKLKNEEAKETNNTKKKTLEAMKGSIAYMEASIKKLEDERDNLATNAKQYEAYTKKIENAKDALNLFKIQLEGASEIKSLGSLSSAFENIQKALEWRGELLTIGDLETESGLKDIEDFFKRKDELRKSDLEKEKEAREKSIEYGKEFVDTSTEFINTLFERKIQKYDDEINKNNEYYAKLLDNDKLTEEQRSALEAERDRKNLELEKKKRKEQRKQAFFDKAAALANIAINTAVAITKVLGQTGLLGIPLVPVVAGLGALQAATVLAQPIPKFAEGHLSGTHEGKAVINDANRSNYQEVVERRSGQVEVYKDRNAVIDMQKGDKVHKSFDSFFNYNHLNEMERDIWMMNLQAIAGLNQDGYEKAMLDKITDMTAQNEKTLKEIKRMANRPINVNNNVKVDLDKRPYY